MMAPLVAETLELALTKGIPYVIECLDELGRDVPEAKEWASLLRSHSLALTYDEQIRAAEKRAEASSKPA